MKISIIIVTAGFFCYSNCFAQDTTQNQQLSQNKNYQVPVNNHANQSTENHTYTTNPTPLYRTNPKNDTQNQIYRDTRLGSSSPLYNTYEKNDYGAGSVTTNPNKGSSAGGVPLPTDITNQAPMDTTLNNSLQSNSYETDTTHKR